MAAGRSSGSGAMLYALITFVGLFLVAVVCAVVFYVKSEEYRTQNENVKSEMLKIANITQQKSLGKIVGGLSGNKTYLGVMEEQFNKLISIIAGVMPEDIAADARANDISIRVAKLMELLGPDASPALGPNGVSLIGTIEALKGKIDAVRMQFAELVGQNRQLQEDFDAAKKESAFKETQLVEQTNRYQKNADDIQAKYDQLQQLMGASADEQIQSFKDKLENEQTKLKQKHLELTESQAALAKTEQALQEAVRKLEEIKRPPNIEQLAFKTDARILRVDLQNGLVYLDIGTKDHVYRGLTFAVYDRAAPIPEDGQGKAEIEVFQVSQNVSVARIVRSNKRNPIVQEDLVANLIWDSTASNRFVVAGDFDVNSDGKIDSDGAARIREMIERWGGTAVEGVTIDTDFVIAGQPPQPIAKPSRDEADLDPMTQQRYEQSLKSAGEYAAVLAGAKTLSVPVFNQKKFLYLIGFDTLMSQNSGR